MQVTPDSGGRQLSPPATPASAARLRVSPNQPEFGPKKPCTCPKTHVPKSKAWRHIVNFPSATPASAARLPISPYLDLIFVPPNLAKKHVCPNLAQKLMCQNLNLVKIISTGHPRLSSPAAILPKFGTLFDQIFVGPNLDQKTCVPKNSCAKNQKPGNI